ncbi:glycosyltransferase [Halorhabdus rudnickae]|uniref:glycosyltransferase n=1 Tax=Halorhabdus rudnickae TaxID=1775544 RepID=UPI0010843DF8|nr:glycosyltransferase [Halorhabdus rudnickae]
MHLTQVAPYVSYPPRLGGDHRTHGLVKEFPQFGDTVERFCQGGSPAMYKSLDFRRQVTISKRYTEFRHLHPFHEILKAPMLVGYPNLFQGHVLKIASDGLDDMLERADVVLAREPWQTPYVLEQIDQDTPVILSSHNVEAERFGDIRQPLFENWVESRVEQMEKRSVEGSDAIVCTSERDAEIYRDRYDPGGPIFIAPNGTYKESLRDHRPDSKQAKRVRSDYDIPQKATVCLFMGSNYKPNIEAAKSIIELSRGFGGEQVQFIIMGSVGKALTSADTPENLTITGYVEDGFEAHFDASDIALNPMQSGGGTNIKLIDYFARSLPVISTPFGIRGLNIDREAVAVAELSKFPTAIEELRTARDRRKSIGRKGREVAAENYTWEESSRFLRKSIIEAVGPF